MDSNRTQVQMLVRSYFSFYVNLDKNQHFEDIRKSVTNLFDDVTKMKKKFSQSTTRRIVTFASSVKVIKSFLN